MNLTLVTIATFSQKMLWVVGCLMIADLASIALIALRIGKADPEEGQVITQRGFGSGGALNPAGGSVGGGTYVLKEKVLFSRSGYISDESLVDGTATKSQRRLVHCAQLLFFLFWLLFVFIGLSLLPTAPIGGAIFIILPTYGFSRAAVGMHRGRVEALRRVAMKRERTAERLGAEKHEN
ncbi:MAG: hypothetical protein WCB11_27970 [Terriglobales bacterium]